MGREPDRMKRDVWTRRLREFERGDKPVAEFCDREGVSVTAFSRWRRLLTSAALPKVTTARETDAAVPMRKCRRGRALSARCGFCRSRPFRRRPPLPSGNLRRRRRPLRPAWRCCCRACRAELGCWFRATRPSRSAPLWRRWSPACGRILRAELPFRHSGPHGGGTGRHAEELRRTERGRRGRLRTPRPRRASVPVLQQAPRPDQAAVVGRRRSFGFAKRLERGTYEVPRHAADTKPRRLDATQLALLLVGVELRSVKRRLRHVRPSHEPSSDADPLLRSNSCDFRMTAGINRTAAGS